MRSKNILLQDMKTKKGILLINLGTPDEATVPAVWRYLNQFLMDGRVIDIPYFRRLPLVRGIIVPARVRNSTSLYKEIWDEKTGSPLMHYTLIQQQMLQEALGDEYHVEIAMRYQNPSIASALNKLRNKRVDSIRIIPLFPQYASATTGSVIQEVMDTMRTWQTFPTLSIVDEFYENELMIDVFAENARKHLNDNYDHYLFSYHGLPVRQLNPVEPDGNHNCEKAGCQKEINDRNKFCYVAHCYATTRAIAKKLHLESHQFTVCFQSRLGKTPWIQPYTSDTLEQLANQGKKRLLVFSPAFVADCLETIHEIGIEYDEDYKKMGGEKIQLVESLNDHPKWIEALRLLSSE